MKRIIKIGFPILCVAVVGGTFYLLNKTLDKVNTGEAVDNEINYSENNTTLEETNDTTVIPSTTSYQEEVDKANQESENKTKAKELAEKKDGTRTQKVYFTNEGKEDDKYLVAVRDEETTEALIYYLVDVETETVEIYY
jgi:tRNA A37 N6-isopentenylltransferase MiaA